MTASLERLLEERDSQVDALAESLKRVLAIALKDRPFMWADDQEEIRAARALLVEVGR